MATDQEGYTTPKRHVWKSLEIPTFDNIMNESPIVLEKKKRSGTKERREPTKRGNGKKPKPKLVWKGTPRGDTVKTETTGDWPEKWTKQVFQRAKGETKGRLDSYWYSPMKKYKFRSLAEIEAYMKIATKNKNKEEEAWKIFKHK
jgi:hypothetical protein